MQSQQINKNLVLKNGRIIDPFNSTEIIGDIYIKDSKIHSAGKINYPKSSIEIDCTNKIITHGFCDIHAHFREPGEEHKETLSTGSVAAVAGGFTRVCVMPNTSPSIDTPELVRYINDKSEELPIYIHPIGAVTKGQEGKELTEMALMLTEGAVAFSDDGVPIENSSILRSALSYASMLDGDIKIINHAEDLTLKNNAVMNEGEISTILGLEGSPDITESNMVLRDLEIAKLLDASIHIPHVSAAKSVNYIKLLKKGYGKITSEVTPHHLFFSDDDLRSYNTNLKVAPPIRSKDDRKILIKALKDGVIDCIATDHAPHSIEEKDNTFDYAPFGMIGLESCFGAVNHVLVKKNNFSMIKLIQLLTTEPRKIMGFDNDLLCEGKEIELIILDPLKKWRFNLENIYSKSKNSPFLGKKLTGKILYTLTKGYINKI